MPHMAGYKNKEWLKREYLENGRSMNEIAEEFDVTGAAVYHYVDKFDIETRDRLEESKKKRRVEYANFGANSHGHEVWRVSDTEGGMEHMYVHRLLAISEYGFDVVANNDVHHENSIPWDNRPENIEPMNPEEHHRHHKEQFQDTWQNKDTPWRDEERLRELYVERGIGTETLGERWGCAPTTVRRWLREYDIEVRDLSEAAYESKVWENAQ